MTRKPTSWVDRVVDTASQSLLDVVERAIDAFSDAAPGLPRGDRWEQLEAWVYLRGDAAAWSQLLTDWSRFIGPDAACLFALREASRLERMLANTGEWDGEEATLAAAIERGVQAVSMREGISALQESRKAALAAERLLQKPRILVGPMVPVPDVVEQITGAPMPAIPPPVQLPPPPMPMAA